MKTRLDPETGKMNISTTEVKKGGYIQFYAEIDQLVAVSVCPMGDGSIAATTPEKVVVRPLGLRCTKRESSHSHSPKSMTGDPLGRAAGSLSRDRKLGEVLSSLYVPTFRNLRKETPNPITTDLWQPRAPYLANGASF